MIADDDLSALTDEAFRRIGRNLINFQKIEGMLKFLIANGQLSGPLKELTALREKRQADTHRTTMGLLARRLVDEMLTDAGEQDGETEIVTEPWITLTIRFEQGPLTSNELREGLRALVYQRNDLVHHLLSTWDSGSLPSTRALLQRLDEQREQLAPVFERLKSMSLNLSEGAKAYSDFLASSEGSKFLEHVWLCHSPAVNLLTECVAHASRADGWTPLATAGRMLRQQLPEHAASLKKRYGCSTLKQLMLATDLFDIWDEPTTKGFRTLFRGKGSAHADEPRSLVIRKLDRMS